MRAPGSDLPDKSHAKGGMPHWPKGTPTFSQTTPHLGLVVGGEDSSAVPRGPLPLEAASSLLSGGPAAPSSHPFGEDLLSLSPHLPSMAPSERPQAAECPPLGCMAAAEKQRAQLRTWGAVGRSALHGLGGQLPITYCFTLFPAAQEEGLGQNWGQCRQDMRAPPG